MTDRSVSQSICRFVFRAELLVCMLGLLLLGNSPVWGQDQAADWQESTAAKLVSGVDARASYVQSSVSEKAVSEEAHLNEIISLQVSDVTLEEALQSIAEKGNLELIYGSHPVLSEKRITLTLHQVTIQEALEKAIRGTDLKPVLSSSGQLVLVSQSAAAGSSKLKTRDIKLRVKPIAVQVAEMRSVAYNAQQVSGTVTDEASGEPLPGANIVIKGTATGTSTNAEGFYSLDVPSLQDTLVYSYVGYETHEEPINGRTEIDVALRAEAISGEELVVVGYSERERGEVTGSVGSISGEEVVQASEMNVTQALQGKIPGMVVNNRGGEPGRNDAEILLRGKATLGNNSPLVIIDGVPRENFGSLSPNDIESINVLKDASAAIYGARAANGVIQIKTKRGTAGRKQLNISSEYGSSSFTRLPEMMSSYEFAVYQNEADRRYGRQERWTEEDIEKFRSGSDPLTHPNTDWFSEVFRDWSQQARQNLSLSGGSENIRYYISGDYVRQTGMYESGDMKYNQYQIRSNLNVNATEYLELGLDLAGRLEDMHRPAMDESFIFSRTRLSRNFQVSYYPNGLPGVGGENGLNPVIFTSDEAGWTDNIGRILQSKISFDLSMDWLTEGLSLSGYSSFDYNVYNRKEFHNKWTVYNYDATTDEYVPQEGFMPRQGNHLNLSQSNDVERTHFYHINMSYDRSIGEHNFDSFIAYEQQEFNWQAVSAYRRDLVSDQKVELDTGGPTGDENSGTSSESGRVNYFGSVGYNYMRKYLIDFSLRYDGSSNFPEGSRFGLFPSVSAGWDVAREPFMDSVNDWLDVLKLRASWAKMGNDQIAPYQYLNQYELITAYNFGVSPRRERAFSLTNTSNPSISWEVDRNTNIGVDATLWNDALRMTVDLFYSQRRDILITRNESIPSYTGLELPDENLGKVDSKGAEFLINYQGHVRGLNYNIGGNMTYSTNEIVFMDEAQDVPDYRRKEGHPIDSWVVYKTDGIYNTQDEIDGTPHLPGTKPGDIKYVDVNGDGEITGADQIRKYTSPIPDYQFGINFGIEYNGIEVRGLLTGQTGAETYIDYTANWNKYKVLFTKRWTEDNKDAEWPRASDNGDNYNSRTSDFWLFDASFVRLNDIQVAYNFQSQILGNLNLSNLRLYVRGSNLFTIDNIKHFDPEINSSGGNYYPQLKTVTLGLNATL